MRCSPALCCYTSKSERGMNMQCPHCGADNSAEILYGLPAMTPELQASLDRKDIVIGGCRLTGTEPKFFCRSCRFRFGSPPKLISKHRAENYMDIVTSVRFSVGSYFDGYPEILVKKELPGITSFTQQLHGKSEVGRWTLSVWRTKRKSGATMFQAGI